MTSPSNGASFVAGASVTFAATAADTDGTIQNVQFYLGTTLIATDTTSPYSTTWPAVVGSHSVNAVATDNQGAVTVAAWRDFTVTATALPATAIFEPASPADAVDYYVFEVFAAGANPKRGGSDRDADLSASRQWWRASVQRTCEPPSWRWRPAITLPPWRR